MKLEFVPLLQLQRDLYNIPRGWERFQEYLRVMLNDDRSGLRLPLVIMNPMGKDHVPALIDALLVLDADEVAARAVGEVSARLVDVPGEFKVTLVVADDLMGGWTNRYTSEFSLRFEGKPNLKGGWLSGILWSSEAPAARVAREAALESIFRAVYLQKHGTACTLREMLAQEGYVMAMAGCTHPLLDADDIAYTREVVHPQFDARDRPTIMGCLFGDTAARMLGYPPQGLSEWAGLALALDEARSDPALKNSVPLSV
jgi:hypothetical protein